MSKTNPGQKAVAVTPSDSVVQEYRFLYVGTGGNIAFVAAEDTDSVIAYNVPDGGYLLFGVKKVLATGTTASNILGAR